MTESAVQAGAGEPAMLLIEKFGRAVTDMFEQMEHGNWRDDHDHHVRMNRQMQALIPLVREAISLRAALATPPAASRAVEPAETSHLSWRGFNVQGSQPSIAEVNRLVQRCASLEQYLANPSSHPAERPDHKPEAVDGGQMALDAVRWHAARFKNPAAHAMRALVLQAMNGIKWRHHGIGVLQGYLSEDSDPEIRVHVWSRRLLKPGMDISGDAHDHRFDMVSHVLCGTIAHEELTPTPSPVGDHRMLALTHARSAADNKFHGPTEDLEGAFSVSRNMMLIEAGNSYTFPAGLFHRSPLLGDIDDVAVTIVEKHRQRDDVRARILYPAAHPPVMAFGHEIDEALVASVLERARAAMAALPAAPKEPK